MLAIARRSLGLWFTVPVVVAAIVGGPLIAWPIHSWGVLPTAFVIIVISKGARRIVTHGTPRPFDPGV